MKKTILALSSILLLSCGDNQKLKHEISVLKNKNDSLNSVLDTLKTKFIFDNAFVKHIVNENQPIEEGNVYTGEFYFVAYNDDDKLLFTNNSSSKTDTLSGIKSGGYVYKFKAQKGKNVFNFKPLILSKTAKEFRNSSFFDVNISDQINVE
ncbi:hypothetical protein [Psychroflexus aestuariivivens]|uniref:hypothetical protein n=1 Tax=Psychroflexus aestuariivivens TaxID=1795040 RepID=UPI000FDA4711|nr:hypothetical protein [Psychroflexus aestuariivivens]